MIWIVLIGGILALFGLTAFIGAPYVPSHRREVQHAFDSLRPLMTDDVVCDLGSGDGIVLVEAMKRGARGIGFEINPILVLMSRLRLLRWRRRVQIRLANFWQVAAPEGVTVVYTFGDTRDIVRMYALVERWANQTGRALDFVSYAFKVEGKRPQKQHRGHFLYRVLPKNTLQPEKT